MSTLIEETLSNTSLFAHLSGAQRSYLAQHAQHKIYAAGDTIITEGEHVSCMFVIQEGVVRVSTASFKREVELKKLGAGAYFGEVSVLSGKTATATVKAHEGPASVIAIAREAIVELIGDDAELRKVLEGVTLARAKDTIAKVLK